MTDRIHVYNNGVACYEKTILPVALARSRKFVNLHEPLEETVFVHIIKAARIRSLADIGSGWGYYSLLAAKLDPGIKVIGIDRDGNRVRDARRNARLNEATDVQFIRKGVPAETTLLDVIRDLGGIDLLKVDIQGDETKALESAGSDLSRVRNIIVGTHGPEHKKSRDLLIERGFEIRFARRSRFIPLQPDGLIWAEKRPEVTK